MQKPLLILLFFVSSLGFAQQQLNVLFIGNSYTYANDLPGTLVQLAAAMGDQVNVDSKTNGGYTFQMHSQDLVTYQKINAQAWDYVVIHGQSQEPSFPFGQVNTQSIPFAMQLADSVYANHECAQVNYFMTWGRENGDPQWDSINTFNKMNARLRDAYLRIADSSNAGVSPVGSAWRYIRETQPSIRLYVGDGSHPSVAGTYLAASVFYVSLFHKAITPNLAYTAGLDAITAQHLIDAANLVVLDSMGTWMLTHPDSLTTVAISAQLGGIPGGYLFEANCSHCDQISWDFGDNQTGTGDQVAHTFANGSYWVTCTATGPCGQAMDSVQITVGSNGISALESEISIQALDEQQWLIKGSNLNQFDIMAFDYSGKALEIALQDTTKDTITFSLQTSFAFIRLNGYYYRLPVIVQ
ncbi:MAG: hypothetical protein K9I25_06710 [Crocinitomicaceae bacterium]|nr:hypothetical protein [Crocinitomicaceae bacterium]